MPLRTRFFDKRLQRLEAVRPGPSTEEKFGDIERRAMGLLSYQELNDLDNATQLRIEWREGELTPTHLAATEAYQRAYAKAMKESEFKLTIADVDCIVAGR